MNTNVKFGGQIKDMIYIMLLAIMVLLLVSVYIFRGDVTSPSVLLASVFFVSAICCCLYANEWKFGNYMLLVEVVGGILSFLLSCTVVYWGDAKEKRPIKTQLEMINIRDINLVIFLIFQVVLYMYYGYFILKTVGGMHGLGISSLIGKYYEASKSGIGIYKPQLVNIGGIMDMSAIYYLLYIAINNIVCKHKNNKLIYINIAIGVIGSLMDGTRTTLYMYITALAIMYIILSQRVKGWKKSFNFLNVLKGCGAIFLLLIVFNLSFTLLGRKVSDIAVMDLLANYVGAPIKNLEFFINDGRILNGSIGAATFQDTYNWINRWIGKEIFIIPNTYKYRWIHGKILGNVYTVFMPLYNDFGIIGSYVIMAFLGIFSQKIYDRIKLSKRVPIIDFKVIIYSYVAFAILFSFFSNKFFELIFARAMIYFLIGISFFDFFFCGIHITKSKLIIYLRKNRHGECKTDSFNNHSGISM